jgi:hypothetical protein
LAGPQTRTQWLCQPIFGQTKRLVRDPAIARKERERFAEIASGRTGIEIQSHIARVDLPCEVKPKGAVINRLCRVLKEPALSDSRHALGEAIGFIRRPRKSVFRETGSKQQRRGRDVVFAQHRNGFSCGEPRRGRQPLLTRFLSHGRRSRREAWQDLLAFWQIEASRLVA